MTVVYLCLLIAAILPYIFVGYAKFSVKNYDNSKPREFLETLQGRAKRAHYAHLNSFEAFPAFAIGIILAKIAGDAPVATITLVAVLFIIFRILYGVFYILDRPTIRSFLWVGGFICTISFYILAILSQFA